MQKPVFVFVLAAKNNDAYKDYFNPDPKVVTRIIGLEDLVCFFSGFFEACAAKANTDYHNAIAGMREAAFPQRS